MPITSGPGQNVNVYAGLTGTLPVTSTIGAPVWVTGTVTAAVSIPSITSIEASVGLTGVQPPASATFVGALDATGNLSTLLVDPVGDLRVTLGTANVNAIVANVKQTADLAQFVTSSQALPVWVTSTVASVNVKQAVDLAQFVTSSQALPIWVTSTVASVNVKQASDLAQYMTSSQALPVWVTGNLTTTSSLAITGALPINGLVGVSGTVAITSGSVTAHADGLVGVTGAVAITSGTITAHADGLVGVTGAIQVSNSTGTLNVSQTGAFVVTASLTNPVSVFISGVMSASFTDTMTVTSTQANPVWATGTTTVQQTSSWFVTSSAGNPLYVTGTITSVQSATGTFLAIEASVTGIGKPVPASATFIGAHDQTGSLAPLHVDASGNLLVVISGSTAGAQQVFGLVGVTGSVSQTNPVLTSSVTQTGSWIVSDGGLGVTVDGLVGVSGTVAITSGVITSITNPVVITATLTNPAWVAISGNMSASFTGVMSATISGVVTVTSSISAPLYISSTIANPVVVTASQANPVTVAVTGALPITGTVTLGLTSSIVSTGLHGVTGTVNVINSTGVLNVAQTGTWIVGGTVTSSLTGTVTVSQSNPVLTSSVTQTGSWVVTGSITTNVPAFPYISGAITNTGDTVTLAIGSAVGVMFSCEGTFSGNIRPQISYNGGVDWHIVEVVNPDYRVENLFTRISSSGVYEPYYLAGATHVRLSATQMTSGQASVYITTNNVPAHVDMSSVENGEAIPKYGTMIGGNDGGLFRFVKVDQSGALYMSASQDRPVWVTGAITSYASATGTFVAIESSVGGVGNAAPISATLLGGNNGGNLQNVIVDAAGRLITTGTTNVNQTGALVVTSTQANPVWITGSISTTAGTQVVTSTVANPVWVTGTTTVGLTGTLPVTGTVTINHSASIPVILTGTSVNGLVGATGTINVLNSTGTLNVAQTGTWIVSSTIANPVNVTASQNSPVTVAVTGAWPVTGTVTINTSATLPVSLTGVTVNQTATWQVAGTVTSHADGLIGVSGTVAITSGVITSITNPVAVTGVTINQTSSLVVSSTLAAPLWVTASSANPVFVGVTGTLTVSQSNTPAGTQYVTSSQASPVWITSSSPITATFTGTVPVFLTGVTVNQTATWQTALTGVTVNQTATWQTALTGVTVNGLVGVSGTVAITSGVITSVTNPVVITATVASPAYVTSTIASPVNVTASSASPVSVTIVGGSSAGKQYLTGTDLAGGTGTLLIGVDATNVARAVFMTTAGFIAVSQTNPGSSGGGGAVTSSQANPVWITGTLAGVSGTVNTSLSGVTVNYTSSLPVTITGTSVNGLVGVSGTVAITSGTLTGITNTVVVTATVAAPLYVTSTLTSPVIVSDGAGGITVDGAILATGSSTPSDAFANPTTALLAFALGAQWDGTQWVRTRGGVSGTLVQTKPAATSAVTQVAVNGNTVVTLLAANTNRLGATIQNAGSSTFASHVKLGTAATLASYTVRIAQNGYYEVPANYNGAITAINSGSQVTILHVTEITQ